MAMTEAQKRYEKKRAEKCKTYTAKYRLYIDTEHQEQQRLENYLADTEQSANSYIKRLIKSDLDSRGYMINTDDSNNNNNTNIMSVDTD